MRKGLLFFGLAATIQVSAGAAAAQTPPQTPQTSPAAAKSADAAQNRVVGEVVAVDAGARQLMLKTPQGESVAVNSDTKTVYRRVPAGEKTLDKAVAIAFEEIEPGDQILARGTAGAAQTLVARLLVVMSKGEVEQKRARDRAAWEQRGIEGIVTAVDAAAKQATVLASSAEGPKPLVLSFAGDVQVRRFSPDSVKYRDARPSSFAALKVGDRIHARGERSADGAPFTPEEVVHATFRMSGGRITSVDAATGEIKINDIPSKKPLSVFISADTVVRRLSPELVKRLQNAAGKPAAPGASPAGEDLQRKIEAMSPLKLTDLKPGDAVLVSSTADASAPRVTAIMVAAGVENYVKLFENGAARRDFNLTLGMPSGIN
ncbi:MAG: hypothetical protein M3416_11725 [Acidobacteriota bacterium]|nr:hypothetical protein [Acidobacteriota bacterium]